VFRGEDFELSLHFLLQYFTSVQTLSHFLRQVNGRLQTRHIFCGRSAFLVFLAKMLTFVETKYKTASGLDCFHLLDLLYREAAWLKNGLFSLLFVYFRRLKCSAALLIESTVAQTYYEEVHSLSGGIIGRRSVLFKLWSAPTRFGSHSTQLCSQY
jgi:hypothetical protein